MLSISSFVGNGFPGLYLSQICRGVTANIARELVFLVGRLTFVEDASDMIDTSFQKLLAI